MNILEQDHNPFVNMPSLALGAIGKYITPKDISALSLTCKHFGENSEETLCNFLELNEKTILIFSKNYYKLSANFQNTLIKSFQNKSILSCIHKSVENRDINKVKLLCKIAKTILVTPELSHLYTIEEKLELAVFAQQFAKSQNKNFIKDILNPYENDTEQYTMFAEYALEFVIDQGFDKACYSILILNDNCNLCLDTMISILNLAMTFNNKDLLKLFSEKNDHIIFDKDIQRELLFAACDEGELNVVQFLATTATDMTQKDEDGDSLLHIACAFNHVKLTEFLIPFYKDLNLQNYKKATPLHNACREGNVEIVDLLIKNNAACELENKQSRTPLHLAAMNGHLPVVKKLFEKDINPFKLDNLARTAFHYACQLEDASIASFLIEMNADQYTKDSHGTTPLHLACELQSANTLRLILKRNPTIDIDSIDENGITPLLLACDYPTTVNETIELLLSHGASVYFTDSNDYTPLMLACKHGSLSISTLLIAQGADINAISKSGLTPLHFACGCGNLDLVKFLIESGAAPSILDADGNMALHIACEFEHTTVVDYLLKAGADFLTKNNEKLTPFDIAAQKKNTQLIKLFIQKALETTPIDTLFQSSVTKGYVEAVQILLDNGANVNVEDDFGREPILIATEKSNLAIVSLLIKHGANPNSSNAFKHGPLHAACLKGNFKIAKLLIQHGAELEACDFQEMNPLDYAQMHLKKKLYQYVLVKRYASALIRITREDLKGILTENRDFISDHLSKNNVQKLLNQYSDNSEMTNLILSSLIDKSHFSKSSSIAVMPTTPPEGIFLKSVLSFFENINFSDQNMPCYVDPENIHDDAFLISKEALKLNLHTLVNNITNRTAFLSTPRADDIKGLEEYYSQIENRILMIIQKALLEKDLTKKLQMETKIALALAKAGGHCGDKYISSTEDLFDEIVLDVPYDFVSRTYHLLNKAKRLYLMLCQTTDDTHEFTTLLRLLGKRFKIPGASIADFEDPFAYRITPQEARTRFYSKFTFENIFELISQELFKEEFQNIFYKWAEENLSLISKDLHILSVQANDRLEHLLTKGLKASAIFYALNEEFEETDLYIFAQGDIDQNYDTPEKIRAKISESLRQLYPRQLTEQITIDLGDGKSHTTSKLQDAILIRTLVALEILSPVALDILDILIPLINKKKANN